MTSPEFTVRPLYGGRRAGPETAMSGTAGGFTAAGFTEVARPKRDRSVMRYKLP